MEQLAFEHPLTVWRRAKGYSQEALAQMLGVNRYSIIKWESCVCLPSFESLVTLGILARDVTLPARIKEHHERVCSEKEGPDVHGVRPSGAGDPGVGGA